MDREAYYLCIPPAYDQRLGGLRWANSGDALEYTQGGVFAFGPQLALFLQGFLGSHRLPHFGHALHLLHLLGYRQTDLPAEARELALAFDAMGRPLRNAGALCAHLCRDVPPVPAVVDGEEVCRLLGDSAAIRHRCVYPLPDELIPLTLSPAAFEGRFLAALRSLTLSELYHWLLHGSPPVELAATQIIQQLPTSRPRTLAEVLEQVAERQRLAGAVPFVAQLVSALALPPRRLDPQELPVGGYVDVCTRGQPEQILPSQFAVEDLEFVRRYAEHELLYFRREEPSARVREELVLLLDQGVRTWGIVRLVLTAAVLAFGKLAHRRRLPVLIATTGTAGKPFNPLEVEPPALGERLEASDLSPHPGLALERVLEEPTTAARDVVLLSHPRALGEADVAAAARRVPRGTRLFALTVTDQGQARLDEVRRGVPVPVRQFRVDLSRPAEPAPEPPAAQPWVDWTGDVEPVGFPFRFGINNPHGGLLFDFDAAGDWLLVASNRGMLHAYKIDGSQQEVLPRGVVNGKALTQVDAVLGVAGGFVVAGSIDRWLVAVHYDFVRRRCTAHVLDDGARETKRFLRWFYFRPLHSVAACWQESTCAVDLSTGGCHPPRSPYSRHVHTQASLEPRAVQACAETAKRFWPAPRLDVSRVEDSCPDHAIVLNPETGMVRLGGLGPPWGPFTPLADGKPLLKGYAVQKACYSGHVLAATFIDIRSGRGVLHLFRDGVPAGEVPYAVHFTLSADGRLLARQRSNNEVEVRPVGGGDSPLLVTRAGGAHHRLHFFFGARSLHVRVGRWYHVIEWRAHGLEISRRQARDFEGGPPSDSERFRIACPQNLPPFVQYDPGRFVDGAQADGLIVVGDASGQLAVFDRSGKLICMFFIFRNQVAGWMPDGTRFGPAAVTGGPATADAHRKLSQALRAVSGFRREDA